MTLAEQLVLHMADCVDELLREADEMQVYAPLRKLELMDMRLKLRRMIDEIKGKMDE